MGDTTPEQLQEGLARVCSRVGLSSPQGLKRLTGGATMESWRFECGDEAFVLRRAPSLDFMDDRPYGHDTEAAVIRKAHERGVKAPEVVTVLETDDGIGSGFVMRALPGTANPGDILQMEDPEALLRDAAQDLARIHTIKRGDVPYIVPVMDYREAIAELRQQFLDAGGDRPIIALGLKWMEDNCPPQASEPVLIHGDYRMGNLLAEGSRLTGVLDWELAHFGDRHEDLAFGCMTVWRFGRIHKPALGLGSLQDYIQAYEAQAGVKLSQERFRYWLIHRTVWWALGCLKMAAQWRSGADRMLERTVISRRTSENELDLLLLLEREAPPEEQERKVLDWGKVPAQQGEASAGEIAMAIAEWLETIKDQMRGHDRFQNAVARNALGIIAREQQSFSHHATDKDLASHLLCGEKTLASEGVLQRLRSIALEKLGADMPKYPALRIARRKWIGDL